jgi:hypothetical protein
MNAIVTWSPHALNRHFGQFTPGAGEWAVAVGESAGPPIYLSLGRITPDFSAFHRDV